MKNCLLLGFCMLYTMLFSQIGIGTTSPDGSSVLDVSSTNKGMLIPRLKESQRNNIPNPAKGLMIYNLTENCLQTNEGTSYNPNWQCVKESSASVTSNCSMNGFEGAYINGTTMAATNKFSVMITNNSFNSVTINFAVGDLQLSGINGISVSSVSPSSATLVPGSSQIVEYSLSGMMSTGTLIGTWTKLGLNCMREVNITNGDANFRLPQTVTIISIYDGAPVIDRQGVIDNDSFQIILNIPYTSGTGTYDAYTGNYQMNNPATSEGGDVNSFRISYPAGTFSTSGSIPVTIEVDGDGSFNAKKQQFGTSDIITSFNLMVNGNNKGSIHMEVSGGIEDRHYTDPSHQFIYIPILAADGNVWLNNNLGANYANINHTQFNPLQQATSRSDYHAYGSLFQWGRYSDGHELLNRASATVSTPVYGSTSTSATTDDPGNSLFITQSNILMGDWRVPHNNNLWQGVNGINNPCPNGFRIPTRAEFITLISAEGMTNRESAAASTLALTTAACRFQTNGNFIGVGNEGYYWTSSVFSGQSFYLSITATAVSPNYDTGRASGMSIRCIRD